MHALKICTTKAAVDHVIPRTGGTISVMHAPKIISTTAVVSIAKRISSGTDIDAIPVTAELPAGIITNATSALTINTGTDTNAAITEHSPLPSTFDLSSLESSAHFYLMNPLRSLMIPFSKNPVFIV